MTKAYSPDLRDRVILAVEREGLSRREAARRYRIGEATAVGGFKRFARAAASPARRAVTGARACSRRVPIARGPAGCAIPSLASQIILSAKSKNCCRGTTSRLT